MTYLAPVKDMLFNIEHLARIDQIAQLPGFEDAGLDTAQAVLEDEHPPLPHRGLPGRHRRSGVLRMHCRRPAGAHLFDGRYQEAGPCQ